MYIVGIYPGRWTAGTWECNTHFDTASKAHHFQVPFVNLRGRGAKEMAMETTRRPTTAVNAPITCQGKREWLSFKEMPDVLKMKGCILYIYTPLVGGGGLRVLGRIWILWITVSLLCIEDLEQRWDGMGMGTIYRDIFTCKKHISHLNTVSHSHIVFKTGHQRTCRISVVQTKSYLHSKGTWLSWNMSSLDLQKSVIIPEISLQRKQISWTPKKSTIIMCSSKILPFLRPFPKKKELWDSQKLSTGGFFHSQGHESYWYDGKTQTTQHLWEIHSKNANNLLALFEDVSNVWSLKLLWVTTYNTNI